jgi:hypothetical protein
LGSLGSVVPSFRRANPRIVRGNSRQQNSIAKTADELADYTLREGGQRACLQRSMIACLMLLGRGVFGLVAPVREIA